jgi:catechol 2,3-dioxygenase-like lactoylglutathione lyase family enzyme
MPTPQAAETTGTGGAGQESGTPLLRTRALDHVNLHVRDADASIAFYTEVLGLRVADVDRDAAGRATFVTLEAGPQNVFLMRRPDYQIPDQPAARGLNHICIEVQPQDPQSLLETLRRRGVTLRSGIVRRESERGPTASIYVEDLDGHGVEIKQVLP